MKVLYIGHYKENSGWSNAAIDLIKAIDSVGIDVVCRNIKLTPSVGKVDPKIEILEKKSLNNVDFCIQHVLPHHFTGTDNFKKNIGYFVAESRNIRNTPWFVNLELMDEIWVPNNDLHDVLVLDKISKNVRVIPHAFDISKYKTVKQRLNFESNNYRFKFYYIGELNDRKNISSIIRCFHSEFAPHEQVSLVLKVKMPGLDATQTRNHCKQLCDKIKSEMRLYSNLESYHNEIIITEDFDNELVNAIHASCDCFVSPSHGEGWSIPAFDAMCFGKTPICSNEGGPKDFLSPYNYSDGLNSGWLVSGHYDICNHSNPAFMELFTGNDEWFNPSEHEIKKAMRYYYENRHSIDRNAGLKRAEQFSYENVGQKIKEALNA